MKKLLFFLKLCIYFGIGNIIFNVVCSITEVIVVNNLGMHVNFINSYINNFINNIYIYIIIYFVILILIRTYDTFSVKILNETLNKIRKGE